MAKKDGKKFQVSSRGGKIRVKRTEHDAYEYIFSEYDLNEIINNNNTTTSTPTNTQTQSTHKNNRNNHNKSNAALRNNKRKAELNTSETTTSKKSKNTYVTKGKQQTSKQKQ